MINIQLTRDERWPDYGFVKLRKGQSETGFPGVTITKEKFNRWHEVILAYNEMQDELDALWPNRI